MTDNADKIFQMLRRTVHNDPELQERLFRLSDADEFAAAVCELALLSSHQLEHEEVLQAMRAGNEVWVYRKRP